MNNAIGNNTITQRDGRIEDDKLKHDIPMKRPKSEQMMKTTTDTTLPSSSVLDEDVNDEMRWRRNWQPDLKCCPWRFLQADQYVYLVKANFLPDSYEFLITDLNHFWYESITETEFSKRLQELNPNLEAPSGKILDHIKMNLEQNSSDNLSISKEEGKGRLNIWINSDLSGFPFCWQMIGESAHQEMVSENTTIPLLMMVSELYRRQKALIQIIDEKDREIDNYKAQGCKLTKKNISTVPFDETSFECSMVSSQEFEDNIKLLGTTAFERPGQNLYQHIMTKYTWLHRSTKIEPESDDNDGEGTLESDDNIPSSAPSWINRLPFSLSQQFGCSLPNPNPQKTPTKSPVKSATPSPKSSEKDETAARREELQQKLALEEQKKAEKMKKKRKLAL